MKQYKNTRYRKAKAHDSSKTFPKSRFTGKPYTQVTVGKVHIQFYDKELAEWRFVCGKRTFSGPFNVDRWDVIGDETRITCLNCMKHGAELVTIFDKAVKDDWDSIPSLDEFQ